MIPNQFPYGQHPQGAPGLPQGLRLLPKDELSRLYHKLEVMKRDGKEMDPEYQRLLKYLKIQFNAYRSMQQGQGIVRTAPTGPIPLMGQIPMQGQPQYVPQYIPTQPVYSQPQYQQNYQVTRLTLTPGQRLQLKVQIAIFKDCISKSRPIPEPLYRAFSGLNPEYNFAEYEKTKSQQQYLPLQSLQQQQQNHQQSSNQSSRVGNLGGIDIDMLQSERERRVAMRIKAKYEHLKSIMIGNNYTEEEKKTAAFQIKVMQFARIQTTIRAQVYQEHRKLEDEHKRVHQKQGQIKTPATRRKKMDEFGSLVDSTVPMTPKRRFCSEVAKHRKNFQKFHENHHKMMERVCKELSGHFEKKAKLAREKKEKEDKARLKALKDNDHEEYYKLLREAKEGRLWQLIEQTDQCLATLGAHLVTERGVDEVVDVKQEDNSGSVFDNFLKNEQSYYQVAHRVVEKIEKQPSSLKGGELKEYQVQGLQWLLSLYNNNLNGILADEMGLGKTIQTISLLAFLMEHKSNKGPFLIIAPLSTLENWELEFSRWTPHVKVVRYGGGPQERKSIQTKELKTLDFQVLITQYEFISRDKKFLKKVSWDYIIMDEGHRIKNKDCILVKDLKTYKSKHRLLLTGTPLQNDLKELWALLNFLLPKVFDSSTNFETWFSSPFQAMGVTERAEKDKLAMTEEETLLIIHRLHQVLRPFLLRREKKDVEAQLPEKVEVVIRCPMSGLQMMMYDQLRDSNRMIGDKVKGRQRTLQNSVMQLRKICNHPFLFYNNWDGFTEGDIVRTSGKFELLEQILPKLYATGHKVLIFSQMTQVLDILSSYLKWKNYNHVRLDGNVKADSRGDLVKRFNADPSIFVFLLSTRAGGLGLNLQSSDTVIMFDSDWNPQSDLQAMARAHRIGQKKSVRVFVLCTSGTVEEQIYERAQAKRNAEAKVIQAGKFDQKSTTKERQEMLESIMSGKNIEEMVTEIPDPEQLNVIIARGDHELKIFAEMDRANENKYPLMKESEIPEWVFEKQLETDALENDDFYGRGMRNRHVLFQIDDSTVDLGEKEESEDEIVDEEDTKKRKRKEPAPKKASKKKYEMTDMDDQMMKIMGVLEKMKDGERWIAPIFQELPNKTIYWSYYTIIKEPICYDQIKKKIQTGAYHNFELFEKDIATLVKNAQTYNQQESLIYADSEEIWRIFCSEKDRMFNKKLSFDDDVIEELELDPELNVETSEHDSDQGSLSGEDEMSESNGHSDHDIQNDSQNDQNGFEEMLPSFGTTLHQPENDFMTFWE